MAEFSRIDKPQLAAVVQRKSVTDHGRRRLGIGLNTKAAGHPQVQDQGIRGPGIAPVQGKEEVLAPAINAGYPAVQQSQHEVFQGGLLDGLGPGDGSGADGASGRRLPSLRRAGAGSGGCARGG